jgi:hypothetical protein
MITPFSSDVSEREEGGEIFFRHEHFKKAKSAGKYSTECVGKD